MGRLFTDQHEWVSITEDVATVGLTRQFSQGIGDILHVELPATDRQVEQFSVVCMLRAIGGLYEIHAPISGRILEVNQELSTFPEILSDAAEQDAWVYKLQVAGLMGMLDRETEKLFQEYQYHELLRQEAEERS